MEPELKPGSYEPQDQRGRRNCSRTSHRKHNTSQLCVSRGSRSQGTQQVIDCSRGPERNSTGTSHLDDTKTLGEPNYCSFDPNCFLPEPIVGPDDTFELPPWFLKEIIRSFSFACSDQVLRQVRRLPGSRRAQCRAPQRNQLRLPALLPSSSRVDTCLRISVAHPPGFQ